MFYNNFIDSKSIKYERKFYSLFNEMNADTDKNILTLKSSPLTYNFDFSNGALRDGVGVESLSFRNKENNNDYKVIDNPSDSSYIKGCWLFNQWAEEAGGYRALLILYSSYGDVYYNMLHGSSGEIVKIEGLNFELEPKVFPCNIDGDDVLVFMGDKEGMFVWHFPEYVKKIDNSVNLKDFCIHDQKLFVIPYGDGKKVWYSETNNITNFSFDENGENKFLEMKDDFGQCNKVISFKGNLYVIRDFNIAKVTYIENRGYKISQLYVSNGKIFDKTVCVCGNKIMYLATDGLYEFDGNKASKVKVKINSMFDNLDNSQAIAGYTNGHYYLSCKLNYNDDVYVDGESDSASMKNNALIKINVSTKDFMVMRGRDIRGIFVIDDIIKSEVCVLVRNYGGTYNFGKLNMNGKYFDVSMTKVWKSPKMDFSCPNKYKILKEISIETKQDIFLEVETERGVRLFEIKGKKFAQNIKLLVKAKSFALNFVSKTSDNFISSPSVLVGYL